jgi:putative addiction module component (TIGR02574 family)
MLEGAPLMTDIVLSPEQIAQLTPEQRLALIEVLWDSLDQDDVPITAAQAAELDRRMATYEQDAANAQPWDAVSKRIERNLP